MPADRQLSMIVRLSQGVSTPLQHRKWEKAPSTHPDHAFANYICQGLQHGFRIGFRHGAPLQSATKNMESARLHPQVMTDYLQKECSLGRMLGPFFEAEPLPRLHFNRFGVIPKGTNTGKFRLITDLSFPTARSVNDGITPDLCTLAYTTVDVVASQAAVLSGVQAQALSSRRARERHWLSLHSSQN